MAESARIVLTGPQEQLSKPRSLISDLDGDGVGYRSRGRAGSNECRGESISTRNRNRKVPHLRCSFLNLKHNGLTAELTLPALRAWLSVRTEQDIRHRKELRGPKARQIKPAREGGWVDKDEAEAGTRPGRGVCGGARENVW
jgi:hypothetical protein